MNFLRLYLDFMKKHPKYLLTTLVLMSIIPVNDIYLSKKYGELFESINKKTVNLNSFVTILGILIFLQIAYGIEDIHLSKQSPDLQHHCRKALLRWFFDNEDNSTGDIKTGDMVSKIIRCENILNNWYNKIFSYLIPYLIEFICTIYFVYTIDNRLCTYMFIITLLFIYVLIYSPKSCNNCTTATNADGLITKVYDEIEDILINCTLVMKENTLNDELHRLDKFNDIYKKKYLQTVKCSLKYRLILSAILILFLVLFVLRSYDLLKNDKVSNAMFYSTIIVLSQLSNNMVHTIDISRDMIVDWSILKVVDIENGKNRTIQEDNVKKVVHKNIKIQEDDALVVDNISFRYPNKNHNIINNLSLRVKRNDKIAIVGDIGSGKSTFLKILLKIHEPLTGMIYLNGNRYDEMNSITLQKKIGFMPQTCVLFNRSIYENIRYGNETNVKDEEDISKVLKKAKIDTFKNLKEGLHTVVGKNGSRLSGGQRQLVWLLRLYFSKTNFILLDEPSASLDVKSKNVLIMFINEYFRNRTVLIVTHDDYLINNIRTTIHMSEINN